MPKLASETKTRTTTYVTTGTLRKLRAKLALEARSLSGWVESQAEAYLAAGKRQP